MGPTPPPYMGPSVATQIILNSRFVDEFNVIHIDTADRRPLSNLGRIDVTNIFLAIKQYLVLIQKFLVCRADLVYIPISQTSIGFLKDIPLILLSKLFSKKVVLHLRGGYFREFYNSSNAVMKMLVRMTLKSIDRMIVLGNCLRTLFDGLMPQEKISVVPNGLDMVYNDKGLNNCGNGRIITILFLSSLRETKGFWNVLRSVKSVNAKYNRVKYVFAGEWRNEQEKVECEAYIVKENIADHVEFTGGVTGHLKMDLFKNADIFAFPTYYPMEGHPWVIVEAMAAGLPIITTDQGCIKESVIDGKNGFIIPKKDPNAITEKIIYLTEHTVARKKMGRRSRQLYEANFTEEHFVQNMIDVMNLTIVKTIHETRVSGRR